MAMVTVVGIMVDMDPIANGTITRTSMVVISSTAEAGAIKVTTTITMIPIIIIKMHPPVVAPMMGDNTMVEDTNVDMDIITTTSSRARMDPPGIGTDSDESRQDLPRQDVPSKNSQTGSCSRFTQFNYSKHEFE